MFERRKDSIAQWLSSPDDRRDFNDLLNENAKLTKDVREWRNTANAFHGRNDGCKAVIRQLETGLNHAEERLAREKVKSRSLKGKLGNMTQQRDKLQRERDELADYQAASIDRFQRIAETSAALNAPVTAYIAIRGIPGTATDETDRIGL